MTNFDHIKDGFRDRAIQDSIARKAAARPKVDNQGREIEPPKTLPPLRYDEFGRYIEPTD